MKTITRKPTMFIMADTMIPHAMRDIKKSLIVSGNSSYAYPEGKNRFDLKFRRLDSAIVVLARHN